MKYELTFLSKDEAVMKNVKDLVLSFKAKVVKEEKWGEKTLAYSISKNRTALFFNFLIDVDKDKIKEFKNKLNSDEKILRYLLLVKE